MHGFVIACHAGVACYFISSSMLRKGCLCLISKQVENRQKLCSLYITAEVKMISVEPLIFCK